MARTRRKWKRGNSAGGAFTRDGDLWVSTHVTSPKGEAKVLIEYCGFRDTPEGRQKVILDRRIEDLPTPGRDS